MSEVWPELVRVVAETGSTNADLAAWPDAPEGAVVVALAQSAGRGRLGRSWITQPDGLAMSILLTPTLPTARWPLIGLVAGVSIADALGEAVKLKWPNDLVTTEGGKIGGILAEADVLAGRVIVGIGLNLGSRPPIEGAACVADVVAAPPRAWLVAAIRARLLSDVAALAAPGGPGRLLDRWRARAHTLGRRVRIGERVGVAVDVDHDGALLLRDDAGVTHRVLSGDVAPSGVRPG
jgi:BirA family biotin operon repressor/biotin-[acetyl-CoA-carboxylase] ligase